MLGLGLVVVGGAVVWFIHKVIKTDRDMVDQRHQREMDFLARNLHRPAPGQSVHSSNDQATPQA